MDLVRRYRSCWRSGRICALAWVGGDRRVNSYAAVMARRSEIMRAAVGIDYDRFETGQIGFHYQEMMAQIGYEPAAVEQIQDELG